MNVVGAATKEVKVPAGAKVLMPNNLRRAWTTLAIRPIEPLVIEN